MPETSLVIPIHGTAIYLNECLDSLQNIESVSTEIIFVLDRLEAGVWRNLEEWLEKFDLPWIVVCSTKAGLPSALNVGILASNSEFLARLDSDDRYITGRISRQTNRLRRDPELVAIGGQMRIFSDKQPQQSTTKLPCLDWQIRTEMRLANPLAHPAMMYRLSALEQVGGYNEDFKFAQDYELASRLIKIGKLEACATPVTEYRIHEGQISAINWQERSKYVGQTMFDLNNQKLSVGQFTAIARDIANPKSGFLRRVHSLIPYLLRFPIIAVSIVASKVFTMVYFYYEREKGH